LTIAARPSVDARHGTARTAVRIQRSALQEWLRSLQDNQEEEDSAA